jgi:hypothetical protein
MTVALKYVTISNLIYLKWKAAVCQRRKVISFDDDYRCREARYVTHNSDLPIISAYG